MKTYSDILRQRYSDSEFSIIEAIAWEIYDGQITTQYSISECYEIAERRHNQTQKELKQWT